MIADNRLPEKAVWDFELLRGHFDHLVEIDFDVELTGFSTGEVDLLVDGKTPPAANDPADKSQRCFRKCKGFVEPWVSITTRR